MTLMQRFLEAGTAQVLANIQAGRTTSEAKEDAIALFRTAMCLRKGERPGDRLYHRAQQADERLTAVIAERTGGQRTRWTLTAEDQQDPAIADAVARKARADDTWMSFRAGAGVTE